HPRGGRGRRRAFLPGGPGALAAAALLAGTTRVPAGATIQWIVRCVPAYAVAQRSVLRAGAFALKASVERRCAGVATGATVQWIRLHGVARTRAQRAAVRAGARGVSARALRRGAHTIAAAAMQGIGRGIDADAVA